MRHVFLAAAAAITLAAEPAFAQSGGVCPRLASERFYTGLQMASLVLNNPGVHIATGLCAKAMENEEYAIGKAAGCVFLACKIIPGVENCAQVSLDWLSLLGRMSRIDRQAKEAGCI